MKKRIVFMAIGILLLFAGCRETLTSVPEESREEDWQEIIEDTEDITSDESADSSEEEICVFEEISVRIPVEWKDKYLVKTDENGIFFYQKASWEEEEGTGYLCGVVRTDNMVDWPETMPLAYTDEHMYYFTGPSDVPCVDQPEIAAEYADMKEYDREIMQKVVVDAEGLCYDADEYYFPMSGAKEVPEEILINMSGDALWYARNEIYARHGFQFQNQYLNDYFMKCSWYTPSIEAKDFDESILSEVERNNINKIIAAEEEYKKMHPGPAYLAFGKEYSFDLDGDGLEEVICLKYTDKDTWHCVSMTLNHNITYEIYADMLSTRGYYITDLDEQIPGLEIAILDFGPSDDPAMWFYTYDGDLNELGCVDNMSESQYHQKDDILVGFEGYVNGQIRADVIYSCFADARWKYDYSEKKIELVEQKMYTIGEDGPYELIKDITIYEERDLSSDTITLKAQNIYFLESDAKEWMKVKGADGVVGYMHVTDFRIDGVEERPEEIILGLPFFG